MNILCVSEEIGRGLMNAPVPCSPQGVTSGTAWSGWSPPLRGGGRGRGGAPSLRVKKGTGDDFRRVKGSEDLILKN